MDGLPSGIAIIKNTNLVYHNKKLSKLLHIPLELSDDSRIERVNCVSIYKLDFRKSKGYGPVGI